MILKNGECKRGMHYGCDYGACIRLMGSGEFRVCPHLRGEIVRAEEATVNADYIAKHFGHGSNCCEECGNILLQKFMWEGKQLCLSCYREKKAEDRKILLEENTE